MRAKCIIIFAVCMYMLVYDVRCIHLAMCTQTSKRVSTHTCIHIATHTRTHTHAHTKKHIHMQTHAHITAIIHDQGLNVVK